MMNGNNRIVFHKLCEEFCTDYTSESNFKYLDIFRY